MRPRDPFAFQVCPLLLSIFRDRIDFPLMVRCMRAATTLLRDFGHTLVHQCEPVNVPWYTILTPWQTTMQHRLTFQMCLVLSLFTTLLIYYTRRKCTLSLSLLVVF